MVSEVTEMLERMSSGRKRLSGTRIAGPGVSSGASGLLARADRLLMDAAGEDDPRERFLAAYLAALRGAGAVLACAASQRGARERSRNAWVLMARSAPEFAMWADYFAEFSDTRAALEAGIAREVSDRQADDFYARVGAFLHDVEDLVGDPARLRAPGSWDVA
jgi:hypothetical protein